MGTEDSPVAYTEPLQNGLAYLWTQNRIRVHRSHQDGGVLVVFRLLCSQTVHIDVNISRKGDVVQIVDQHDLAGQMSTLSFEYLKKQITKFEEADLGQGGAQIRNILPGHSQLVGIYRFIRGENFADVDIGPMQGILFPESVFSQIFILKAEGGFFADNDLIEQIHQAAVIYICMGQQKPLAYRIKFGDQGAQDGKHFILIAGIAAVYNESFTAAPDDGRVASAGRLDQDDLSLVGDPVGGDSGNELIGFGSCQKLCKFADGVKGPVGGKTLLIQGLHGKIGGNKQPLLLLLGQIQHLGQTPDVSRIEDAVVIGPLRAVVIDDPDFADLLGLLHKGSDPPGIFDIKTHFEVLIIRAVFLGVDVGNVKIKVVDQLQNGGDTAGGIFQTELDENDAGITGVVLEITDFSSSSSAWRICSSVPSTSRNSIWESMDLS